MWGLKGGEDKVEIREHQIKNQLVALILQRLRAVRKILFRLNAEGTQRG